MPDTTFKYVMYLKICIWVRSREEVLMEIVKVNMN